MLLSLKITRPKSALGKLIPRICRRLLTSSYQIAGTLWIMHPRTPQTWLAPWRCNTIVVARPLSPTNSSISLLVRFLLFFYVLAYFLVLEVRLMHGVIFVFVSQVQVLCRRSCGFRQSVYVHWIFIIDSRKHPTCPKLLTSLSTPSGVLMSR